MSEMVERVARAIYDINPIGVRAWEDAPTSIREDCLACARAAIAAMTEPVHVLGEEEFKPIPAPPHVPV